MRKNINDNEFADMKLRLSDKAWGYSDLHMRKEAIAEIKKLLKIDPNDYYSLNELALCYAESGREEKAMKCYRYMMKQFPNCAIPYVNLGYYYERIKKQKNVAALCYEKALDLDPKDAWVLNNVGASMAWEGKWEDALAYYKKACEISEQNNRKAPSHFLHNLAWAYYRCKMFGKARSIYEHLINECPDKAAVFSDFGCVSYKMGNYSRALDYFAKALEISPDSRHYKRLYRAAYNKVDKK